MIRGSCFCGGIRFEAESVPLLSNCHCSKCRKAYGAAFNTVASIPLDQFRFVSGQELIQTWEGDSYTPSFCRQCGSPAPWVDEERKLASVPAGLLDDDPGTRVALHMFVGSKAPWCEIDDGAPQFDEFVPGYGPDDE